MVTQEEFEIILESFEEWLRQRPQEKNRVIMFKGRPYYLWQLLNEMKAHSSIGYEFAEYLKQYGSYALGVTPHSDIFESLASEIRKLAPKMLIGTWTFPSGFIISMDELADEILKRTQLGKSYVKDYMKLAIERAVRVG